MSTTQPGQDGASENVFVIEPQETIWTLARQLISGQHTITQLNESARLLRNAKPDDPAVLHHLSQLQRTTDGWFRAALPNLLAEMQVAVEAHDTFGPGFTRVEDPIDAAAWNNKVLVWRERLGGTVGSNGEAPDAC
ncbi:hypothetical protein BEL07_19045 [Mycolicibacterium grossiae]|uniref:Uncharacterized protein n=1 Tax=Mycolicibacterium grossiae TaxID=1552759 RepID=A0A1E8Q180_9MYCO|nr:hypothetical protein [Mycolicibacterium grossiae]OFJ52176.1 hypothetical protein BEL07_19045 [Mycolicibacterium grossiae]